jgi:predicted hydrocarbon binding protein
MSDKTPPLDFERAWQGKLITGLDQLLDPEERNRILTGSELLTMESSTQDKVVWSCEMLERLEEVVDEQARQEIMTGCACHYPKSELDDARGLFLETGDVDQVIDLLQAKFESFLREIMELDEELVLEIISRGWGLAGVREGTRIFATKIPKSGYLVDYFQSNDPGEKRKLYCHCPRVRDGVGEKPQLPETYCYCGAGFYQGIWETILGEPVRVEVLESVMTGGDVCKIAVHLPESIILNSDE